MVVVIQAIGVDFPVLVIYSNGFFSMYYTLVFGFLVIVVEVYSLIPDSWCLFCNDLL